MTVVLLQVKMSWEEMAEEEDDVSTHMQCISVRMCCSYMYIHVNGS